MSRLISQFSIGCQFSVLSWLQVQQSSQLLYFWSDSALSLTSIQLDISLVRSQHTQLSDYSPLGSVSLLTHLPAYTAYLTLSSQFSLTFVSSPLTYQISADSTSSFLITQFTQLSVSSAFRFSQLSDFLSFQIFSAFRLLSFQNTQLSDYSAFRLGTQLSEYSAFWLLTFLITQLLDDSAFRLLSSQLSFCCLGLPPLCLLSSQHTWLTAYFALRSQLTQLSDDLTSSLLMSQYTQLLVFSVFQLTQLSAHPAFSLLSYQFTH